MQKLRLQLNLWMWSNLQAPPAANLLLSLRTDLSNHRKLEIELMTQTVLLESNAQLTQALRILVLYVASNLNLFLRMLTKELQNLSCYPSASYTTKFAGDEKITGSPSY